MGRHTRAALPVVAVGSTLLLLALSCTSVPQGNRPPRPAEPKITPEAARPPVKRPVESPPATEPKLRSMSPQEQQALELLKSVKGAKKTSILERFIKDHPYPRVILLAKFRIAEIDCSDVETQNPFRPTRTSNSSWQAFVNYYAFGDYIPVPDDPEMQRIYYEQLHPLLIQAFEHLNSFDSWIRYLTTYSENPYFGQAAEQVEKFLLTQASRWEGYEMLKSYLALCDVRLKHPSPNRDLLIRTFQEELANKVEKDDRMDQYRRYLEAFPDASQRSRIVARMDRMDLNDACIKNDRVKMKEIIRKYEKDPDPMAKQIMGTAVNYLERLEFKDAVTSGTVAALRDFTVRYKGRDYADLIKDADARLTKLHDQMLVKARAAGGSRNYRQFLESFPDTPQRADVDRWLEEAEFKEAMASRNRDQIMDLLTRYPNSRMRQPALDRLEDIDYGEQKTKAVDEPSPGPLKRFLETYPSGRHGAEARKLIADMEQQFAAYTAAIQKARDANNASQFSAWLIENQTNYFSARRGQKDLDALKRELATQQLNYDLTAAPTGSRTLLPIALARALSEYEHAVGAVEVGGVAGTGFVFNRDGLVLTNAHILRNAEKEKITVKIDGQGRLARIVAIADPAGPDVAILRIEGTFEPVPLGNSSALSPREELICLAVQGGKIENLKGAYINTRRAGQNEWVLIQSSRISPNQGGVILNQRARAVAIMVPSDSVDPAVRENAAERVYALSLRSIRPLLEKAVVGE